MRREIPREQDRGSPDAGVVRGAGCEEGRGGSLGRVVCWGQRLIATADAVVLLFVPRLGLRLCSLSAVAPGTEPRCISHECLNYVQKIDVGAGSPDLGNAGTKNGGETEGKAIQRPPHLGIHPICRHQILTLLLMPRSAC
ncbi:uncharacterized protein LOC143442126 isoform X2 [Arvicanthis niloticus]|uniref:uncharacterized protein LOC143312347 isoform X1 n=1 Tax=Arvicanthis niloticus TaxID=61156 RepID=UPI00402B8F00